MALSFKSRKISPDLHFIRNRFLLVTKREKSMNRIRIILADDHRLFVDALQKFLEPEFDIVGTFNDGYSLVRDAPRLRPDLIILDIGMPVLNGLSAGRRLKRLIPKTKLIYLTMNSDRDVAAEAFSWELQVTLSKTLREPNLFKRSV